MVKGCLSSNAGCGGAAIRQLGVEVGHLAAGVVLIQRFCDGEEQIHIAPHRRHVHPLAPDAAPFPRGVGEHSPQLALAGAGYASDQLDAARGVAQQHVVQTLAEFGQLVDPAGEVGQRIAIPRHRFDVLGHAGIIAAVSLSGEYLYRFTTYGTGARQPPERQGTRWG